MNSVLEVLASIRARDLIDIALLAVVIYWLLQLIKGTRTILILLGLTVLLATYILAKFLELAAIGWLMENIFSSAVVILVVLFQADVRNALARIGISTMFREISGRAQRDMLDEVVEAAATLADRKIGATIVLERETGLRNYIDRGTRIMADPTAELLQSIFHTSSPLHDGAVIITQDGHLAAARCILPLSSTPSARSRLGTRHRSAIGLSEESDALIIVVSEERKQISLAALGKLELNLNPTELRARIDEILRGEGGEKVIAEAPVKANLVKSKSA